MTTDPVMKILELLKIKFSRDDSSGTTVTEKQARDLLDVIELLIRQRDEAYSNYENLSISFRYESNEQVLSILMKAMHKHEEA